MKCNLLSALFIALSVSCFGQHPALLYDSRHPVAEDSIGIIKRIKSSYGKKLKVVYTNGQKRKIYKRELWGFQSRNGRLYRLYDNKAMRVIRQGEIVKYEYKQPGTDCFSWRYSANLDSPVYRTKRKARRL
jgi:hypothetical protein